MHAELRKHGAGRERRYGRSHAAELERLLVKGGRGRRRVRERRVVEAGRMTMAGRRTGSRSSSCLA